MLWETACRVLAGFTVLLGPNALAEESASADPSAGWRLGLGTGVVLIDDVAGNPVVPTLTAGHAFGGMGAGALDVIVLAGAGRYNLTGLVLDLGAGLRKSGEIAEVSFLVGPAAIVAGDHDGGVYNAVGATAALTGTYWLSEVIGVSGRGAGRLWLTNGNPRFTPSLTAGVMFRL